MTRTVPQSHYQESNAPSAVVKQQVMHSGVSFPSDVVTWFP